MNDSHPVELIKANFESRLKNGERLKSPILGLENKFQILKIYFTSIITAIEILP